MSAWIKMIRDENASAHLREVLRATQTPHGTVDNVMRVHSLRPSTMKGHFEKSNCIKSALDTGDLEKAFTGTELALLRYAEKLTKSPELMKKSDVDNLKELEISDGEILEANQIICYFNYVNRTINGLGVSTTGDTVGYYKSNSKS